MLASEPEGVRRGSDYRHGRLECPQPWVCLGLVKLSLGIEITASEKQEQSNNRRMLFERLGALTYVKDLFMLALTEEADVRAQDGWSHPSCRGDADAPFNMP